MGTVNRKDIPAKYNMLGQYFTPSHTADFCLDHTTIDTDLVIEPSCGEGVFLTKIAERWTQQDIIGVEVDGELLDKCNMLAWDWWKNKQVAPFGLSNLNFYDFNCFGKCNNVTFIGNPPFRTPAISLTDDPIYGKHDYVRSLAKKYGVTGVREEAVFFIIKSVDLILSNKTGHIYYILPKSIFHNNSRSYKTFTSFLKNNVRLESVWDIGQDFDKVNTDLCYVHFVVDGSRSNEFLYNGERKKVDEFYGVNEDLITFHKIFKKTYLGSVPCESILLSVKGEPLEHFKQRLIKLMNAEVNESNLIELLSYNGEPHLMALKKRDKNKIKVVLGYVNEIKGLLDKKEFTKDGCYKEIQHRHEVRYYFRHNMLKKASFIYQLNPNPTVSFYFPGNPGKSIADYYGYCSFDCNRNSTPGAIRCVPIQGIENNLTDEFKSYWKANTNKPFEFIFEYLIEMLKSDWWKYMKNKYQRFYFCIPTKFNHDWISDKKIELVLVNGE